MLRCREKAEIIVGLSIDFGADKDFASESCSFYWATSEFPLKVDDWITIADLSKFFVDIWTIVILKKIESNVQEMFHSKTHSFAKRRWGTIMSKCKHIFIQILFIYLSPITISSKNSRPAIWSPRILAPRLRFLSNPKKWIQESIQEFIKIYQ